jgi:glycosyltransferase involved in cell wall biosynthesis
MSCDAVGNFAVSVADFYARNGVPARVYAAVSHPDLAGIVAPVGDLDAETITADTLWYHFSTEDVLLPHILSLPWARRVCYYHNVTPARWFREAQPSFADSLDRARGQLPLLAAFDAVFANSRYSLEEVRPYLAQGVSVAVLPPSLDPGRLAALVPEPVALPAVGHTLLWVGRFAPHKRPELALELFALVHGILPEVALVLVAGGRQDFPDYAAIVERRIAALPDEARSRLTLLENLSEANLAWLYRNCSLLLCTSGHEGYCLPVAEAMSFGLPVAALPQEAVWETLGGQGTILREDPAKAAATIAWLLKQNTGREIVSRAAQGDALLRIWDLA